MICEGLLPSHIHLYGTSPSWITLLLPLIPQEFTIASCLTVYRRAEQPRVELDQEITAGSYYNAKVNLPGVLQLNFN